MSTDWTIWPWGDTGQPEWDHNDYTRDFEWWGIPRDTPMTEITRLKEVEVAAEWWAQKLYSPPQQDNGDAFQSGFATAAMLFAVMKGAALTEAERDLFKERLATRIECHIAAYWKREDAQWGSAYRTLGVDYGPDLMLSSALIAAVGQTRAEQLSLLWPIKTRMWINPGEVKVSHGYRAEPVTLYKEPEPVAAVREPPTDPA